MFRTIRWRLAASYALLILLSVTLMGTLALSIVQSYVSRQESVYLRANAMQIAGLAERFLLPPVRRIALEELASTSAFLGDARVRIMDTDRLLLADSGDPGLPDDFLWLIPSGLSELRGEIAPDRGENLPIIIPMPARQRGPQPLRPRELMPLLRDLPLGTSFVFARRDPTPWGRRFVFENMPGASPPPRNEPLPSRQVLSTTLPVGPPDAPLGWVEMSSPLSLSKEAISPMRDAILFSGLGALVVAAVAGFLVGRTMSDPLRNLAATARHMAGGDLSVRAPTSRKDEIGDLARQFNGMAESLEKSFRDLRADRDSLSRFVADASHELRTPITALATFNELLQGHAADDPTARQEFLRESQSQLERLQWITTNLLDLSRLDAGIAGLTLGPHSAAEIVDSAAAGAREAARQKGVELSTEAVNPETVVVCDAQRVHIALSNLVTNAVKFTPPGGRVEVSVSAADGRLAFCVRDTGLGIPPGEQDLIFERFYRGRTSGSDGAGLGLAIVRSVARAHGGEVTVQSTPGAGSLFRLEIPLRT
ncbi:MAG TPA: HAMP domain-containing sensor histidine kinase [Spirochaetia bacterium]|nr:HAMP domain-containing sensor histidine kinase [Spirochaetia bacterium]